MKRLLLLLALVALAAPVAAQPAYSNSYGAFVTFNSGDPAGSCANGRYWWNTTSKHQWICDNATWTDQTAAGTFTGGTITAPILAPANACTVIGYSFDGFPTDGLGHYSFNTMVLCKGGAQMQSYSTVITNSVRQDFLAGSAATPGLAFSGGTTTGLYLNGSPVGVGFSAVGANVGVWSGTALDSAVPFYGVAGSSSAPTYAGAGFTNTGMYFGAGGVRLAVAGTEYFLQSAAALTLGTPIREASGSAAAPSYAFTSGASSGMWYSGGVSFSVAGAEYFRVYAGGLGPASNPSGTTPQLAHAFNADTGFQFSNISDVIGIIRTSTRIAQIDGNGFNLGSGTYVTWNSAADPTSGSVDVGLLRHNAGELRVSNGSTGWGHLQVDRLTVGAGSASLVGLSGQVLRASNTNGTSIGYMISGQVVEANTATKSPSEAESGELYTNTGDADGSVVNLPNDPTIGTQYRVALTVAQTVTINAGTGETIQDVGTSGTSTAASAVGDTIHLVAVTGGSGAIWMVVSKTGTWTTS